MLGNQPTGVGLYLTKNKETFSAELMNEKIYPKFSKSSLEYIDMMQEK